MRSFIYESEEYMDTKLVSMIVAAGLAVGLSVSMASGQTRTWRTAGNGTFSASSNWVSSLVPGPTNVAAFGLTASTTGYTVSFTGNAATAGLNLPNQRPTFNLGGFTYNITGDTTIGGSNGPRLTVTNGTLNARAGGGHLFIGQNAGQPGTVVVSGGVLNGLGDVGFNGIGTVTIQNAGSATVSNDQSPTLGNNVGAVGTLTVTGVGSTLTQAQNELWVGRAGTGTLNVSSGATLTTPTLRAAVAGGTGNLLVESGGIATVTGQLAVAGGDNPGNRATLTVRGAGSTVNAGTLSTYGGGQATITIESGGRVNVAGDIATWVNGTSSNILVTGSGSQLNFGTGGGGRLDSSEGTTSITVNAGGQLGGNWLLLSDYESANSSVTVDGAGSSVSVRDLSAASGSSDIRILNGAHMTVVNQFLQGCCRKTASKSLLVRGTGSELLAGDYPNNGGNFYVGQESTGSTVLVDQGGKIRVKNNSVIGSNGGANFEVSGAGSSFDTAFRLQIGGGNLNSNTTFSLTNGATASLGSFWMGIGNGAQASASISGTSLMTATEGVEVHEGSTLSVASGGGVEAVGGFSISGPQSRPAEVIVGDGSYIFASRVISLGSNRPQTDAGILTLNGGTVFSQDYVYEADTGVIRGVGTFAAGVFVRGTLQPGSPIGTMSMTRATFNDTGRIEIQIGGTTPATEFDQLALDQDVILKGTLALSLANGFSPAVGQTFDIMTAGTGRSGTFDAVTGNDLGGGKAFVIQYLPNAVRLAVDGVTGVDITQPSLSLYNGFSYSLAANAGFALSSPQVVTSAALWTSDNPAIATVSANGKVTAHALGNTTISVTYSGFSDSMPVTVEALPVPAGVTPGLDVSYQRFWWPRFDSLTPIMVEARPTMQILPNPDWSRYGSINAASGYVGGRMHAILTVPNAGDYEFTSIDQNGEARVFINGELAIYQKDATVWVSESSAVVSLPAGPASILVEYMKSGTYGGYSHQLEWKRPGMTQRELVPASVFAPAGVTMEYYLPPSPVIPTSLAEFNPANYDVFVTDTVSDLDFPLDVYPNFCASFYTNTAAKYTGWLVAPATGAYTLYVAGFGLYTHVRMNGAEIGSNGGWPDGNALAVQLSAGLNAIEIEGFRPYFANDEGFRVDISGPDISRQPIPATAFWHGIPAPSCVSDFNQDGGVDGADVSAFFDAWEAGNSAADMNGDGGIDGADVNTFFAHWEAGC